MVQDGRGVTAAASDHAEGLESHNPSLDEPWEPGDADALVQLYESGDARAALQSPFDDGYRERLSHLAPSSSSTTAYPDRERSTEADRLWLESKLAGITGEVQQALAEFRTDHSVRSLAHRFGHFEQRFEAALGNIATRTDIEGLRLIEAHVSELSERAEEAKGHLSHLLAVEAQVTALKESLSDERISRLVSAVAPTQQELARLATIAAETVVQRAPDQRIAGGVGSKTHDLLSDFIEERRRSEQLAGEALETMQHAMQHILDRIDSIEMTQAALIEGRGPFEDDEGLQGAQPAPATAAAPVRQMADRSLQDAPIKHLTLADLGLGASPALSDDKQTIAPARKIASPFQSRDTAQTYRPTTFPGAGMLLVAGLSAFMLAGYWLVSGIGIRAPLQTEMQTAETRSRPAGKGDVVVLKPSSSEAIGPVRSEDASSGSHAQAGQVDDNPSDPEARARLDQPASAAVQPPMGMVIEQNPGSLSPEEIMRMRQRQRMANLSTRLGQQQQVLETGSAAGPVGSSERGAGVRGASAQSNEDPVGTILEMPPITIGPQSLRIAAAKGDPSAQFDVAARFAEGKGVKRDFAQAAVWYQRAATQGLAAAQYRLAALYERGLGVTADTARARVWYKRAAEQGNLKAMHNMAVLSAGKDGTTSDYEMATKWFTEAAEHGVTDSQYNLAVLLESGLGIPKDQTAAYRWYALAARGGIRRQCDEWTA
ncbi:MAG: sel1 repeat family protein [Sphingomonadales bacterium]|nr:sel1 repeat family protein [Sphingomonadales bacterium]